MKGFRILSAFGIAWTHKHGSMSRMKQSNHHLPSVRDTGSEGQHLALRSCFKSIPPTALHVSFPGTPTISLLMRGRRQEQSSMGLRTKCAFYDQVGFPVRSSWKEEPKDSNSLLELFHVTNKASPVGVLEP